ncbi:MAG TPA: EF-hand domain-containing protein [Novosphingobium sp.]|nr:EF-hand domain-containing protein [Novosphingobium sp.]HMP55779.1 EF-hand domain-containing protein [Novosphingobium sp.]
MNKLLVGLALAATTTGAAWAADHAAHGATGHQRMAEPLTRAQAEARAGQMFERMDANKDGRIDAADRAARQAAMFDRIDADKDGRISREEFSAHHATMGRGEGRRGEQAGHKGHRRGKHGGMMGQAMLGPDGAATRAEFTAAALARFDHMDANKDGQVTAEERRAAREAMRQQRSAERNKAG